MVGAPGRCPELSHDIWSANSYQQIPPAFHVNEKHLLIKISGSYYLYRMLEKYD